MGSAVARLVGADYAESAVVTAAVSEQAGRLDDFEGVDAIIDFSLPAGTERLVDWMSARSGALPALVSGTTGLDAAQRERLLALGNATRVLHASNFSPGVAAVTAILGFAAPILKRIGYRPVMTEVHHRHKRDAPSGTALALCRAIDPDEPSSTEVHSVRAGEIIGRHEVVFYGPADRIVIGHEALSRDLFARGAIEAALWLCDRPEAPGRYTMDGYFAQRYLG